MPAAQRPQQKTAHSPCGFYEYPEEENKVTTENLPWFSIQLFWTFIISKLSKPLKRGTSCLPSTDTFFSKFPNYYLTEIKFPWPNEYKNVTWISSLQSLSKRKGRDHSELNCLFQLPSKFNVSNQSCCNNITNFPLLGFQNANFYLAQKKNFLTFPAKRIKTEV